MPKSAISWRLHRGHIKLHNIMFQQPQCQTPMIAQSLSRQIKQVAIVVDAHVYEWLSLLARQKLTKATVSATQVDDRINRQVYDVQKPPPAKPGRSRVASNSLAVRA